ncbi:uncharacterized protein MYCFIDRAFT_207096 [Pseudocercospora fijiensis CIRAD86]|uniref:Uncharacterized protein n=1 Tax=Pseudocercospora fijiensis (strain CIRAD86) TaxID=383855 RepID=M3B3G1_PSEFD|nr:uncharacterized protein MYCFIDRAFT_207096 [Pseudocercospora fijiensis CIRAD86]EME83912.1 hypothetical protein MYCFIDRAFT_207096 [Pseudocercospora fijiensis CIRAD86]
MAFVPGTALTPAACASPRLEPSPRSQVYVYRDFPQTLQIPFYNPSPKDDQMTMLPFTPSLPFQNANCAVIKSVMYFQILVAECMCSSAGRQPFPRALRGAGGRHDAPESDEN